MAHRRFFRKRDYLNGVNTSLVSVEVGTSDLGDRKDWSDFNRLVADVKVSDGKVSISLFFWNAEGATTSVDAAGMRHYSLNNIRAEDGRSYFAFEDGVDGLDIVARGGPEAGVSTPGAAPAEYPAGAVRFGDLTLADPPEASSPLPFASIENGGDLRLAWMHLSKNDSFAVWRSVQPYLRPGAPGSHRRADVAPPLSGTDLSFLDPGVVGNPEAGLFYVIVAHDLAGVPSPAQHRVGAFSFALAHSNPPQ